MSLQYRGGLPTRYFKQGVFEGAEIIDGESMTETLLKTSGTCYACPIACKRVVEARDKWGIDPAYGGPEYETTASLGSLCGIDDLVAISKANELCSSYGLDTIGTGATIAWAMECYEDGLITSSDTGGLELRFGNAEAMVQLVEQIALREGFGDILADGSYRAAERIGGGARSRVMHVKKQEIPMHEPRIKYGLDIGYAISPTGADHNHNIHDYMFETQTSIASIESLGIHKPLRSEDLSPAKVRLIKRWINARMFDNCVGLCNLTGYGLHAKREIVSAATGWDYSLFEMQETGERVLDMARVFNFRCGFRAEDDTPPSRFFAPLKGGPSEGKRIPKGEFERALCLYYDMMGWDHQTGAPLPWKLHELGLGWLVHS
jgi:aldehyde:ferredoxin oxidoreductase